MIGPTGAVRVMAATRSVDFRKAAEGLAALVRKMIQADPFGGAICAFRAKRADRVKMVFWDGTGGVLTFEASGRRRVPLPSRVGSCVIANSAPPAANAA